MHAAPRPQRLFQLVCQLALPGPEGAAAAATLHDWVQHASGHQILELAAAARSSFRHLPWSNALAQGPIDASFYAGFAVHAPLATAALLSTHRSGYVREHGLAALAASGSERAIPFLLLRTDDIVTSLRATAVRAVEPRLRPELAPTWVRCLRIVEALRGRSRSGGPLIRRIGDFLGQPSCRAALLAAGDDDDDDAVVRRHALALRMRFEPAEEVLRAALTDLDWRVRTWAARTAMSRATSAAAKWALLPALEASRSAWTRRLAIRARAQLDPDDQPLETALLDPHATVRYEARTLLRARHPERPVGAARMRALAVLARSEGRAAERIGALGSLADLGTAADLDVVARDLEHPHGRVRAEARRTYELLRKT